jgi:hypothetical protein
MPVTSNQVVDAAKTGAVAGGGAILMGPTLGAPAAGVAASYLSDSSKSRMYAVTGLGIGMLSLAAGGSGGGSSGGARRGSI